MSNRNSGRWKKQYIGGSATDIGKELHIPVKLEFISKEKLIFSFEICATSTAGVITLITKINGKKIGLWNFGENTRKLYKIYWGILA